MATPAQISANQANAQRSTGPVTAQGKQRSALNALRHGFRSQLIVLPGENPADYQLLTEQFEQQYPANTPIAARAVREMIDAEWRLRRVRLAIDRTLFELAQEYAPDCEADGQVQALVLRDLDWHHPHLLKHELKYERQFNRAWRAYRTESVSCEKSASASRQESIINDGAVLGFANQTQAERTPNEMRGGNTLDTASAPHTAIHANESQNATNEPKPTPRNAACLCGSGLKYKRCCGRNAPAVLSTAA
jgi:hypothetical protein